MNRERCFKQQYKIVSNSSTREKSSIAKIFRLNVPRNFFEMHQFYIIWLYAFRFITCKIVFLYLVPFLLHQIGNFLEYIAAFLMARFWGF